MGKTRVFLRYAMPLCAVALLCSTHSSFAQSPLDASSLTGKWALFSAGGHEMTIPREKIEIEDERLMMRDDCNDTFYRYAINDGHITASPGGTTLLGCNEDKTLEEKIALRIQEAIVAAITHSKIQLSGDILQLTPLPGSFFMGELRFRREK
jgi:heat shock protein HslJ